MNVKNILEDMFRIFLMSYKPQGWWPVTSLASKKKYAVRFDVNGYHHGDYGFPKTNEHKFEIAVGAVLTQNTAWTNVRHAIANLLEKNLLFPGSFMNMKKPVLAQLIRPSGYFNQKAKKLVALDKAWQEYGWKKKNNIPSREQLLNIWGVGEETADSILLYAFHQPVFVVDAYTKRIFSRIGLCSEKDSYRMIQSFFMDHLEHDEILFNEYHALIVEHAKSLCRKKPLCENCCINHSCSRYKNSRV
ncbi:MAG: DNA repair protein [Spirochaetales bacterium]|nr:DNA repair protein [Spirochaetales bacterium]